MDPAVSIVIPVYNRDKLICRCLDSVWAQTYRPLHVFVVDNNSSDGTPEAVRRWCRDHGVCDNEGEFRLHLLSELKGRRVGCTQPRSVGGRHRSMCFSLNSDDEMHPYACVWRQACHRREGPWCTGRPSLSAFERQGECGSPTMSMTWWDVSSTTSMLATQVYMARTAFYQRNWGLGGASLGMEWLGTRREDSACGPALRGIAQGARPYICAGEVDYRQHVQQACRRLGGDARHSVRTR